MHTFSATRPQTVAMAMGTERLPFDSSIAGSSARDPPASAPGQNVVVLIIVVVGGARVLVTVLCKKGTSSLATATAEDVKREVVARSGGGDVNAEVGRRLVKMRAVVPAVGEAQAQLQPMSV
jgi:hypothetical protein